MIVDYESLTEDLDLNRAAKEEAVELYGLVHQRYIQTEKGLQKMQAKWARGVFGHCPRVLCNMTRALPYGEAVDLGYSEVKIFCPLC